MVSRSHAAVLILMVIMGCHMLSVTGSALKCQKEGRFPHPDDCGSYVDCLPTGAGGQLEAREDSCFGFPYSPSHRRCVSHDLMPECVTKSSRDSIPLPYIQFLCEGENSDAKGCYHCKLSYECIGGNAHTSICSDSDTCSEDERFGGGSCLPYDFTALKEVCKCQKIGLIPDSYNSTFYIFCDTSQDPPQLDMSQCPQGEFFSSDSNDCEYSDSNSGREPPETPPCDGSTATRVNPNDCSWSYTCLPSGTVKSVPCKTSEYFNEDTGNCEDKCNLVSPPVLPGELCVEVGNNKHPTDCTKYHVCIEEGGEPYSTEECPQGTHFDTEKKTCVSGEGDCPSFSYSQCPGYDDSVCT